MEALKSVLMEMKASSLKGKAKEEYFVQKCVSSICNKKEFLIKVCNQVRQSLTS